MDKPLYEIGEVVYLAESAKIGMLESVTIVAIYADANVWVYTLSYATRAALAPIASLPTFGDMYSKNLNYKSLANESELLTACDAYSLIEQVLVTRLEQVRALIAGQC